MSMPMNKKAGLFGLAMHFAIVVVFVAMRTARGERFGPEFLFAAFPLLLVSSYLVYSFVISRYLKRREGMARPLFIDALVGMLVEYIIFTLAGALFGIFDGLRTGPPSGAGMLSGLLTSVFMNILWVYATFMVQILVLGNLCGLVGWVVLKKMKPVK
jgi:hypothetical protein